MERRGSTSAAGDLRSTSAERTREIGRGLGAAAFPGTLVALVGPLGAGKTQLAKGVADGLGVRNVVNSPTFVLMNEHPGRLPLFHVDAYRLDDAEEAVAAGLLDERQAAGVTVVEWADRLEGWLAADRLIIQIEPISEQPTGRVLRWRAHGAAHADLANATLAAAPADEVAAAS